MTVILLVDLWEESEGGPALVWSQRLLALRMFRTVTELERTIKAGQGFSGSGA